MKTRLNNVLDYYNGSGLLAAIWILFAGSAVASVSDNQIVFATVGLMLLIQLLGLVLVQAVLGIYLLGGLIYERARAYAKTHAVSIPAE